MTNNELIRTLREYADLADGEEWEVTLMLAEHLRQAAEKLEQMPQWIPVEERLPEVWQNKESGELINYMIHSPYFGVDIGNYHKDGAKWLCMALPCTVTHWMPLPEPPEVAPHESKSAGRKYE